MVKALEQMGHTVWLHEWNRSHYLITNCRTETVFRVAANLGVVCGPTTKLGFSTAIQLP